MAEHMSREDAIRHLHFIVGPLTAVEYPRLTAEDVRAIRVLLADLSRYKALVEGLALLPDEWMDYRDLRPLITEARALKEAEHER